MTSTTAVIESRPIEVNERSTVTTRVNAIHNYRGLAILFIVATHSLRLFDWSASPDLIRILKHTVANGTIFFLFISGYLFEYLKDGFRPLEYWSRKARYVVLPYLLCSIPALVLFTAVLERWGVRPGFYDQAIWRQVVEFLLTGAHLAPYWFIPTIIAFFVAAPLLAIAFRQDRAFWILPVLFVIPALMPRSLNPGLTMLHFLPVWVLGMAVARFRSMTEPALGRGFWVLLVVTIAISVVELQMTEGTHTYLSYLQKTTMTLLLMSVMLRLGRRLDRALGWAATLSFGMFFVHTYVISGLRLTALGMGLQLPSGSLSLFIVAAVLMSLASAGLVAGIRVLLGKKSRLVIGV